MNDWFGAHNIEAGGMQGLGIMHCCSGNGSRALYAAFYDILSYDEAGNTLKVNLLLNRASKWADIDSHIPYKGQVNIKVKRPVNLSVRIPGWVNIDLENYNEKSIDL